MLSTKSVSTRDYVKSKVRVGLGLKRHEGQVAWCGLSPTKEEKYCFIKRYTVLTSKNKKFSYSEKIVMRLRILIYF